MAVNQKELVQELKRRGYTVTSTPDGGLLVEKDTFWGKFAYDSGIGKDFSSVRLGRVIILSIVYFIGIIGGLYWLYNKGKMQTEVRSILAGR